MNIQWYPGHMTKTRRQIEADLKNVDIVVEIVDARIPVSSRNPDIDAICGDKPRLIVLNRADQADPRQNKAWGTYFKAKGHAVLETDAKTGRGVAQFSAVVRSVLKDQIARWRERGQVGRPVRAISRTNSSWIDGSARLAREAFSPLQPRFSPTQSTTRSAARAAAAARANPERSSPSKSHPFT